ncbi:MAG: Diaminopimelate epimerase [Pseudomonadota bacterium]|jgi:diaminopimelate epimerase
MTTATADTLYVKMNGIGNEILVVDVRGQAVAISPERVRTLAGDTETAFDQLMVLADGPAGVDAAVRIFNSDGSEAGACGNGMRCVAWVEAERTGRNTLLFSTGGGLLSASVESMDRITIDMGRPRLRWDEIPLRDEFYDTSRIELQIGPIDDPVLHSPAVVNMGNPHAVFFVADVGAHDLGWFCPMLENHPMFPERANISLAQVVSPSEILVRTWERGAGLTKACGSAACAVLVSAVRRRLSERTAAVRLPGGTLEITWDDKDRVLMTGPVEVERRGRLSLR